MVQSNLIIHFTLITFGGYSSELKKVIDRFIPTILPFFTKRNGEIHHKYRYGKRGSIIAVGVLDTPNEEKEAIFKEVAISIITISKYFVLFLLSNFFII